MRRSDEDRSQSRLAAQGEVQCLVRDQMGLTQKRKRSRRGELMLELVLQRQMLLANAVLAEADSGIVVVGVVRVLMSREVVKKVMVMVRARKKREQKAYLRGRAFQTANVSSPEAGTPRCGRSNGCSAEREGRAVVCERRAGGHDGCRDGGARQVRGVVKQGEQAKRCVRRCRGAVVCARD